VGVAVVTDSTADLPAGVARAHGVSVVPLQIVIGAQSRPEGVEVDAEAVAQALRAHIRVRTSRPNPAAFLAAYQHAAEAGASGVLSLHLSAHMSGTHSSATLAAAQSPVPVRVVDSHSMGMALGFAVLSAARRAAAGGDLDECYAVAEARVAATSSLFYVDSLEHLRRGGRIGAAQAFWGNALAVKPLLHLCDGRVEPLERVRTASRAIARLEELALEAASGREVDMAVHHLASADRAELLAEALRSRTERLRELLVSEIGAVVGAHVGPGMLGVVVAPVLDEVGAG
jgi:DegV family protein with EDD domain